MSFPPLATFDITVKVVASGTLSVHNMLTGNRDADCVSLFFIAEQLQSLDENISLDWNVFGQSTKAEHFS
jgi:hypothetical protein